MTSGIRVNRQTDPDELHTGRNTASANKRFAILSPSEKFATRIPPLRKLPIC